jgi:hypothetical protein
MADIDQAKTIAEHMREKGKPDDQIRDTLRAWNLADADIDGIIAALPPCVAPPAPSDDPHAASDDPHAEAAALAAKMRQDGRADDWIRDSLRARDIPDPDIDAILAAAPPAGKPHSHEIPEPKRPAIARLFDRLNRFVWWALP